MLIWNSISILLQEAFNFIRDIMRIMGNCESGIAEAGFLEDGFVLGFEKLRI